MMCGLQLQNSTAIPMNPMNQTDNVFILAELQLDDFYHDKVEFSLNRLKLKYESSEKAGKMLV